MVVAVYAVIAVATISVVYSHVSTYFKRKCYSHIPSIPIPITWKWFLGHIPHLQNKRQEREKKGLFEHSFVNLSEDFRKELGTETNTIVFHFPGLSFIYTVSTDVISRVFSDHKTFMKAGPYHNRLAYVNGVRVLGYKGLLTEAGTEVWYHKRKLMDPAFQKKYLKDLMGDMTISANKLCHYLQQKKSQNSLEIYSVMNRVALEIVCKCGFSLKDDFIMMERSELSEATESILEALALSFTSGGGYSFKLPWKFRAEKVRLKEGCALLRGTMRKLLAERVDKNTKEPDHVSNDILDHIIRGRL